MFIPCSYHINALLSQRHILVVDSFIMWNNFLDQSLQIIYRCMTSIWSALIIRASINNTLEVVFNMPILNQNQSNAPKAKRLFKYAKIMTHVKSNMVTTHHTHKQCKYSKNNRIPRCMRLIAFTPIRDEIKLQKRTKTVKIKHWNRFRVAGWRVTPVAYSRLNCHKAIKNEVWNNFILSFDEY